MLLKQTSNFLLIIFICVGHCKEDDIEEFIPTKNWQVVKKGQRIPKGLHIRINFETGITEAKLLDPDEKVTKGQAILEVRQEKKVDSRNKVAELFKQVSPERISPEELKEIKDNFRSYEEIKSELEGINLTPKLDAEIMSNLMKEHQELFMKQQLDATEMLRIIEDLDFLAHQYDNAQEFVRQDGFKEVLYKNLNITNPDIVKETLKLMSSLTQNNIRVQIHALESGAIPLILRILAQNSEVTVQSSALSALGSLLRHYPIAQIKFKDNGGVTVISKVFEDTKSIKIKVKLATLMADLISESDLIHKDNTLLNYHLIVKQYEEVDFRNLLVDHNWCGNLNTLLHTLVITDIDDHDSIEKCLLSMVVNQKNCGFAYNKDILTKLQSRYISLIENNSSTSDYFSSLVNICTDILSATKPSPSYKTEL